MLKTINTNLKFAKHSQSGKIVSFINKKDGLWRGVRESFIGPKLIVLPDVELVNRIEENTLYKCKLVPMGNKNGYVAVSASPLLFNAKVSTEYMGKTFKIYVKIGNLTIVYDPNSKEGKFNDFESVSRYLATIPNIANYGEVVNQLRDNITIAKAQYV